MKKKHVVKLSKKDKVALTNILKKGTTSARKMKRCQILLLSHEGKTDNQIVEHIKVSLATAHNIQKKYTAGDIQHAIEEKSRPGAPIKYGAKEQAAIIAIACSEPPEGYARWTLQLIGNKAVQLQIVDSISNDTVHRTLKKTNYALT